MLFVTPLAVAVRVFWGKAWQQWSYVLARDLRIVSISGLAIFVGIAAYSAYIQLVRSPAAYALEWQGTYAGRQALVQLVHRGQEALPDLQHVIAHGHPSTITRLARSMADHDRPETDVPLLILALGQCQGSSSCKAEVSAALRKVSGLDLADGTSAKSWQEHWHQHLTHMNRL
jgi:hypothetical protein